jgi:hypothetical protein
VWYGLRRLALTSSFLISIPLGADFLTKLHLNNPRDALVGAAPQASSQRG